MEDKNKYIHNRAVGLIRKEDEILLIRRILDGEKYYVFPGGTNEEGESQEETLKREMEEELCIEIKSFEFLFKVYNPGRVNSNWVGRDDYFYLITEYTGEIELGGPEKERMNEADQYYLEWHKIDSLAEMKTLYPEHERVKVCELLKNKF